MPGIVCVFVLTLVIYADSDSAVVDLVLYPVLRPSSRAALGIDAALWMLRRFRHLDGCRGGVFACGC